MARRAPTNPAVSDLLTRALARVQEAGALSSLRVALNDLPGSDRPPPPHPSVPTRSTPSALTLSRAGFPEKQHADVLASPCPLQLTAEAVAASRGGFWMLIQEADAPCKDDLIRANQLGFSVWFRIPSNPSVEWRARHAEIVRFCLTSPLWNQWLWPSFDILLDAWTDRLLQAAGHASLKPRLHLPLRTLRASVSSDALLVLGGDQALLLMARAVLRRPPNVPTHQPTNA